MSSRSPILEYAVHHRAPLVVLTKPRVAVFITLAATPLVYLWPSVSLLGDYGYGFAIFAIGLCSVSSLLAFGVLVAWNALNPVTSIEAEGATRFRARLIVAVVLTLCVLTLSGLPTRMILTAHIPLFCFATRDVTPSSPSALAKPNRIAGIYRVSVDTGRGGITLRSHPWWGLGVDDGNIAWDEFGDRRMVYNTAGDGTLIGKWIWWDED